MVAQVAPLPSMQPDAPPFAAHVRALLRDLPDTLEWLVAFDIATLRDFADEALLRAAWFVDSGVPLDAGTIVLTQAGRAVFRPSGQDPVWTSEAHWPTLPNRDATSLADAFGERLALLRGENEFCLGLGLLPGERPVAMNVVRSRSSGLASAVLDAPPEADGYSLLAGCGVSYLGTQKTGPYHVATFQNRLSAHLTAALASAFERTHNCNLFFLRGARLDSDLTDGLIQAGRARIMVGLAFARAQAQTLAVAARQIGSTMTALDAAPSAPYALGDLVPIGFLLHALGRVGQDPAGRAAATLLERHLDARAQDGLWPFESGRLVTATDSSLVLLGRGGAAAVERLERFADGHGLYLPQLASRDVRVGHMLAEADTEHWTRADLGTTCVVRHLRRVAGLPLRTPLGVLRERFASRSGLFFANPFLVDWLFALALADEPEAADLRERLANEIAAAVEPDFSFGQWDQGLSTVCAILALEACGRRGRLLHCAQLRLLDGLDAAGQPEASRPFYSTLMVPEGSTMSLVTEHPGSIRVGRAVHAVTVYEDSHRVIGTALRLLALAASGDPTIDDLGKTAEPRHPRYAAPDLAAYLRDHALPPYLMKDGARTIGENA